MYTLSILRDTLRFFSEIGFLVIKKKIYEWANDYVSFNKQADYCIHEQVIYFSNRNRIEFKQVKSNRVHEQLSSSNTPTPSSEQPKTERMVGDCIISHQLSPIFVQGTTLSWRQPNFLGNNKFGNKRFNSNRPRSITQPSKAQVQTKNIYSWGTHLQDAFFHSCHSKQPQKHSRKCGFQETACRSSLLLQSSDLEEPKPATKYSPPANLWLKQYYDHNS